MWYEQKTVTKAQLSVSLMFLPYFDVFCGLLLFRHRATWNLLFCFTQKRSKNASSFKSIYNSAYHMTNIIAFEDYMHLSYKPLSYQFTKKSRFWELHWNSQDQNLPVHDCKKHSAQFLFGQLKHARDDLPLPRHIFLRLKGFTSLEIRDSSQSFHPHELNTYNKYYYNSIFFYWKTSWIN